MGKLERVIERLKHNLLLRDEAEILMKLDQFKQTSNFLHLKKHAAQTETQIKEMKKRNKDLVQHIKILQTELHHSAADFEKQLNQKMTLEYEKTQSIEILLTKKREETSEKVNKLNEVKK